MRNKAVLAAFFVVLLALPNLNLNNYILSILTVVFMFAILATSLDLVMGYAGQFSFAHGAFYGIGAYTAAILHRDLGTGFWQNLPLGMACASVFGLILGFPSLRLSGHFLAITTIAFQTIVYLVLTQWTSFTGGQFGIAVPKVGATVLFGRPLFAITTPYAFYYLALAAMTVSVLVAWRLASSRLGKEWQAIRDDELLARMIGIDATRDKLVAFVISAGLAGGAGVLSAYYVQGVSPNDFSIWTSATVVGMVLIGGRGTIVGAVLGAAMLTLLPEILRPIQDFRMVIFGLLMILTVQFLPRGLVSLFDGSRKR